MKAIHGAIIGLVGGLLLGCGSGASTEPEATSLKTPFLFRPHHYYETIETDVTLADYFAAQALTTTAQTIRSTEDKAKFAYDLADAMLKERKRRWH